jgi:uncharacterized membrane protein/YHS domain-containing protein
LSGETNWWLFLGRLHPLLLHLPIGLLVLLAFLEFLSGRPRFRNVGASIGLILAAAVPLTALTALLGWLLSREGGYDQALLRWHLWSGIATAVVCLLAGVLYRLERRRAYRFCIYSALVVLAVASHFGGSLTHGKDYLARYAPKPLKYVLGGGAQPAAPAFPGAPGTNTQVAAFPLVIHPIFENSCVSCHGAEKAKGGLRLDSFAGISKGGEGGPVLVPGRSAESAMIKRILLPVQHDDHMPPDGKPQPSEDDVRLLRWWIDSGASPDKPIAELNPSVEISRILATRMPSSSGSEPHGAPSPTASPQPLAAILPVVARVADEANIAISPLAAGEPWLQCNAGVVGKQFDDTALGKLGPLGSNIVWLDLSGTGVTDAGLVEVRKMPHLKRLYLQRTAVTDAGLSHLSELRDLEYINLYGTTVTDAGLSSLKALPRLKRVYLWNTKVTPEAAREFAEARNSSAQVEEWRREIERLKGLIQEAQMQVELGLAVAAATSTNACINQTCPYSDKPIDASKTATYEGKTIAFCCADCLAKFQKDPSGALVKLGLKLAPSESGK